MTRKAWTAVLLVPALGFAAWRATAGLADDRAGESAGPRLVEALDAVSGDAVALAPIDVLPLVPREAVGSAELRLRLLEADGTPVHAQTVRVRFEPAAPVEDGDAKHDDRPGYVQEGGALVTDLPHGLGPLIDASQRRLLLTSVSDRHGNRLRAELALPDELAPGPNDLGDLRLTDGVRLADGLVVDSTGAPAAYATVAFRAPADSPVESVVYTDADGRFRIVATDAGATSIELTARRKNAHTREPITVASGARGLHLRLFTDGALRGRVRFDSSHPSANLRVVATPSDERGDPIVMAPARNGEVQAFNVPSGRYTVTVATGDGLAPVHVEPDVDVRGGAITRMFDLDLRDALHELVVEVGATDRRAISATLHYRPAGEPDAPWSTITSTGRAAITTQAAALDLRAESWGYLPASLEGAAGNARITLEPAFGLEFELRDPRADSTYRIEARDPKSGRTLAEADLEARPSRSDSWHVSARPKPRRARVTVPRAGRLALIVTVTRDAAGFARESVRIARTIDVREGERLQDVTLRLRESELPWAPLAPAVETDQD